MTTNVTFSFMEPTLYSRKLQDGITFHIERTSHSIARLYFTDDQNLPIEKPQIFHVYSYESDGVTMSSVIQRPVNNLHYFLCWTDNYSIYYDQKEILTIDSNRTWIMEVVPNSSGSEATFELSS